MIKIKLSHLIAAVAAAGFLAVTFSTLGILVVQEVRRRAMWDQVRDSALRRVPAYLGERRAGEEP